MFIIHGRRTAKRKCGYVPVHCPSCLTIRPCRLNRVAQFNHIFWLTYGKGDTLGFTACCETCSREIEVEPTDFQAFCRKRKTPLPEMIDQTIPALAPGGSAEMTKEKRLWLIKSPLLRFNVSAKDRLMNGGSMDGRSWLALLGVVAGGYLSTLIIPMSGWTKAHQGSIVAVALGLPMLWLIVELCMVKGRFFRKNILPMLVAELRPLKPSAEEVKEIFRRFKMCGYHLTQFTSAKKIMAELEADQSGSNPSYTMPSYATR